MSRLRHIKAAQQAAANAGEPPKAASNKPEGRLQQIKRLQLEEAEKGGVNPYQRLDNAPAATQQPGDLSHYQAAMEVDIGKIAAQKDIADKVRVKALVLPTYLPFVEDYVSEGHNYPNDVAVQVMIWLLDTGQIESGLKLALHLVAQNQRMPAKFDRDMKTFLCDFFYDWAGVLLKEDQGASPYLDQLVATAEHDKWDVHVLCMSKLYVMLAKHKERAGEYSAALELCNKAEAVNPEKAGVKGLKERLQKRLENPQSTEKETGTG